MSRPAAPHGAQPPNRSAARPLGRTTGAPARLQLQRLAISLERTAPAEVRLFKAGLNETTKGNFYFTARSAELVMSGADKWGNALSADYEHATLDAPPEGAPAAAWYELEIRDSPDGPELWAVNIQWTARAKAFIEADEYRYISPTFWSDSTGQITAYMNFALTNHPATLNMQPLLAASRRIAANRLTAQAVALGVSLDDLIRDVLSQAGPHAAATGWVVDIYTDALIVEADDGRTYRLPYQLADDRAQLEGEITEVERTWSPVAARPGGEAVENDKTETAKTEVKASTTQPGAQPVALTVDQATLVALAGLVPAGADLVGTITAWRDAAGRVEALATEVATLKAAKAERELGDLLDQAQRDGKLTPALREQLTAAFTTDAGINVTALRAYVAAAPVIVPVGNRLREPVATSKTATDRPDTRGKAWEDLSNTERHALRTSDPDEFSRLYTEHKASLRN